MGLMDNIKNKMGDMDIDKMDRDTMMQHYNELSQRDQRGELNDNDRSMLSRLRERLNMGSM